MDYGEYYASKTAAGTDMLGRRVLFGFLEASVNRQAAGADRWSTSCGEKLVEPEAIPREVTLRPDGGLGFEPVAELQALRVGSSELSKAAIVLKCGDTVPIGDLGHSFEVRASFTTETTVDGAAAVAGGGGGVSFGVTVLASASGEEATAIGVSANRTCFFVDKTRSTQRVATPPVFKDFMTAPLPTAAPGASTSINTPATTNITAFVDGRVLEAFVEGRVISTLVYPSLNSSTELGLFMRCDGNGGGGDTVSQTPSRSIFWGDTVSATASVSAWALRAVTVAQHNLIQGQ